MVAFGAAAASNGLATGAGMPLRTVPVGATAAAASNGLAAGSGTPLLTVPAGAAGASNGLVAC